MARSLSGTCSTQRYSSRMAWMRRAASASPRQPAPWQRVQGSGCAGHQPSQAGGYPSSGGSGLRGSHLWGETQPLITGHRCTELGDGEPAPSSHGGVHLDGWREGKLSCQHGPWGSGGLGLDPCNPASPGHQAETR